MARSAYTLWWSASRGKRKGAKSTPFGAFSLVRALPDADRWPEATDGHKPCRWLSWEAVVQTFGDRANVHPHVHAVVTRGGWTRSGEWIPVPMWTSERRRTGALLHEVLHGPPVLRVSTRGWLRRALVEEDPVLTQRHVERPTHSPSESSTSLVGTGPVATGHGGLLARSPRSRARKD